MVTSFSLGVRAWVVGVVALAAATMAVWAQAPVERRPNIIFILADDLGYGDVGCYGQKVIRTPRIDRMATEGVRFTSYYAGAPVCAPSRCQLMTGLHSGHAYIRDNREVQPEGQFPLPEGKVTLARVLQANGYTTGATGKWGLGPVGSTGSPEKQGFDFFYGYNCQRAAHNYYPVSLWRNGVKETLEGNTPGNLVGRQYSHDLIVEEALRFVRENQRRPFFLYMPVTIPHVALQVPEDSLNEYKGKIDDAPYDGKQGYLPQASPHAAYAGMVSRLDRDVGRVLDLLAELGIDDKTLVIFASDNGPTYERIGGADSAFFQSAGGLRGLKGSVYEGGIRVPFIARWPGSIAAGKTVDRACAAWDVMPTLLEVAGCVVPNGLDGISLVPTLTGRGTQAQHESLYWEFPAYGGQQAVRFGAMKAVRVKMDKGPIKTELYDLSTDPAESKDLAAERPAAVTRAEALMRAEHRGSAEFPFKAIDADDKQGAAAPQYPGYQLVWAEEFNVDGPPDAANWVPETGFVRNQEAQWYQLINATCRGGALVIEARREQVANSAHNPSAAESDWKRARATAEYTSASIKTKGKHAWTYGRFEMRGRIDIRMGMWPAFWTVGSGSDGHPARPWPACGEIDIMEYFKGTLLANAAWASEKAGVALWDDVKVPIGNVAKDAGFANAEAWAREFHVWRMDWDENAIRHYVDGRLMNEIDLTKTINQTADGANPFHEPHHIILNLAVGGTAGGDPSGTEFPGRLEVDWVRVYQQAEAPVRIDLDGDAKRQTVVDREEGVYLGHVSTVMLSDRQTILAAYPKGHGQGPVVLKRSTDGGITWSERLPTPESWATSKETPTLFNLGGDSLIMFSGLYPIRAARSADGGATWSELTPIGDFGGIVAMGGVAKLGERKFAAFFHDDGRFIAAKAKETRAKTFTVYQTVSEDAGATWSTPRGIWKGADVHLCEPGVVRSPDGSTIALLLRENRRVKNSHVMFSQDGAATWSTPVELTADLTGDRHIAAYTPDGRLVISFRRMVKGDAWSGDWVAWVGTWEELLRVAGAAPAESKAKSKPYLVRLKDNLTEWDCGYAGLEALADGTMVATTYGTWTRDQKPFILSVRFSAAELDALVERR
ncbi:MAG: sulfatase-like hydrolase/transferase [Planctomycetes bacterium]|nr:sulfatase-like hydrolase/transferase [Planctomycetota bacterium]